MRHAMILAMAVLCAVALASTAEATWITAGGTLEFQSDGFENDTVGSAPVASVGTWRTKGSVSVLDSASPGPFEGDNYLSIYKNAGGGTYNTYAFAEMAGGSVTSGTVVVEHGAYFSSIPTPVRPVISFTKSAALSEDPWHTRVTLSDGTFAGVDTPAGYLGVFSYIDKGTGYAYEPVTIDGSALFVPTDEWVTLRHTLDVGNSFTITVNGVESDSMAVDSVYGVNPVLGMNFATGSTSAALQYYIDAPIPEPGSMVMLLSGACLGLLIWRRRSR